MRKNGENRKCKTCGKEFYAKRCHIIIGHGNYCSKSCSKKGKIPLNLKIAQAKSPIKKGNTLATCLKGRKRPPFSDKWKKNMSDSHKGIYARDKHPNWKGGITGELQLLRHTKEYDEWRFKVYRKYYYHCIECKKHCSNNIVAHHTKDFKNYPEIRFDVNNGVVMCRKCHLLLHKNIRK